MEYKEFDPAYRLLTHTAGFIMVLNREEGEGGEGDASTKYVVTMISRIGLHPIFADIGVWETVMAFHLQDRNNERKIEEKTNG